MGRFILSEEFKGLEKIPDSMCLDSGTVVCSYEDGNNIVEIIVRGYVTVDFNGDRYYHYSDMPHELQALFESSGKAYEDERVNVIEGNWYEICINNDEDYDVAEIDGDSINGLESYCKDYMNLYREYYIGKSFTSDLLDAYEIEKDEVVKEMIKRELIERGETV